MKKINKKKPSSIKEQAINAAYQIVEEKGWDALTIEDIAKKINIQEEDLKHFLNEKADILVEIGKSIDEQVIENIGDLDKETSTKDNLFELMMERIDIIQENRNVFKSILISFKNDPKQMLIGAPHLCKSMNKMLIKAGIKADGIEGCIKIAGMTGVYLKTLNIWVKDETEDLSKTMAELDKNLSFAERAVLKYCPSKPSAT
jgi:ubiquinone biosynthesis protein COQ9